MRILVTGATGFIGRRTLQQLGAWGHQVRCLVRGGAGLSALQPHPVEIWRGDITEPGSLSGAMEDIQAVVHLVGIIRETPGATFHGVHVEGTRNVLAAAVAAGVQQVLFLSGVGAQPNARYPYLASKWQAEELIRAGSIPWTVVRSSVVFGPGDGFLTQLASVIRHPPMGTQTLSPLVPILGSGRTRFQPIHVDDLARCILRCVQDPALRGRTIEVGGPEVFTYEQLVDIVMTAIGVRRPKLHVPLFAVRPAVRIMEMALPNPPLTSTQLAMLELDNVPQENAGPALLGAAPRPLAPNLDYLL